MNGKDRRRWLAGMDDEHWNILMALARRQGQTIGEYLTVVAEREWERETGQKVGAESGEAKG